MKAGASILLCSLVGALVTVALVGWGVPGGDSASAPAPAVRPSAPKPEPMRKAPFSKPTPKPAAADTSSQPVRAEGPPLLTIPRLDLSVAIGTDLRRGPVFWPITGRPGGGDTIAVAGHRTTYTRPFYWLERMRSGDAISIRFAGRVYTYRVSGRRVLSAKNLHIGDARGHEVLLLSACTPRGSARQRIVVYAYPEA